MRMFTASLVALMLATTPLAVMAHDVAQSDATTLDVSAQVDIKAAPDVATINAGVVTVAKTAQEAMKQNAVKMNSVFAALKKAGIAAKDHQTSGMNISPQYVYEQNKSPVITGYQAQNNVDVLVRDLKNIGPALDALVAQGANQINGPTFTIDNPESLLDEARTAAVKKAQKRAEIYASAAGLKIKKIKSISENSNNGPQPYPAMAMRKQTMAADAATPIATGEVTLNVTVNITYELE